MHVGHKVGFIRCAVCLLGAAALIGLGGCSLMTPTLDQAEPVTYDQSVDDSLLVQPGTLTVAVNTNDAPQAMVANGVTQGYAVDVAAALAQHMGLELSVVHGASASEALGSGTADIYIGATSNDEGDSITVTGDYLQDATGVFGVSAESGSVVSLEELAASSIGVQENSASQEALVQAGITGELQTFSNVNECFDALDAGDVQYVACDATAGAYLARAYPGVSFVGVLSSTTVYGVALSSGATELGEEVSETLDSLATDGTLDAIHAAWYGALPMTFTDQAVAGVTISQPEESSDTETVSGDINNPE